MNRGLNTILLRIDLRVAALISSNSGSIEGRGAGNENAGARLTHDINSANIPASGIVAVATSPPVAMPNDFRNPRRSMTHFPALANCLREYLAPRIVAFPSESFVSIGTSCPDSTRTVFGGWASI